MWPEFTRIDWTLPDLAANLALDEALLVAAEDHPGPAPASPVLRFWEADRFAVVLGASGRIDREVHRDLCRADGVAVARRSSGGGTVVIGPGAMNLTVVVPIEVDPRFAAVDVAQKAVLGRVAEGLARAVPGVGVQGSGDLTLGDRKFSGSAQRRLRRTVMIHATLLYDFPLDRVDRYLPPPPRQPNYRRDRPHADFLANLPLGRDAILAGISAELQATQVDLRQEETTKLLVQVESLVAEKFSNPQWIDRL